MGGQISEQERAGEGRRGRVRHVAIVMDGNGRWAEGRGLPRWEGHRAGYARLREIVRVAPDYGIEALTVYVFSSENWRRPPEEVEMLMALIEGAAREEVGELERSGVRLMVSGDMEQLPKSVREELERDAARTAHNSKLVLNLAINYGARGELTRAARRLAERVRAGEMRAEEIDEEAIGRELYTAGLPDPDLLIRTGGDYRVSNFLLWQCAYTELYVTPVYWPDFDREQLEKALEDFAQRERRFGALGPR